MKLRKPGMFNLKDWLVFGGVSGVFSVLIGQILAKVPLIQVTFSTIALNVRDKLLSAAGLQGTLGTYLMSKIGSELTLSGGLVSILAGILLVLGARVVLELIPIEIKGDMQRLTALFIIAAVLEMVIVSGFGIPAFSAIFGFVVGAVALAVLMKVAYMVLGMKLPQ
jgi:hypothetical protein